MPMVGIWIAAVIFWARSAGTHRQGIVQESGLVALDAEAAETANGLGSQADVGHHRNLGSDHGRDRCGAPDAAFQLHGMRTAFLHQAARVFQGLLRADLEAHEWHVGHEQAAANTAGHEAGVVDHLVERDRQAVIVALHDHAERIANEETIDAGGVEEASHGVVVGREHGQADATRSRGKKVGDRDDPRIDGDACLGMAVGGLDRSHRILRYQGVSGDNGEREAAASARRCDCVHAQRNTSSYSIISARGRRSSANLIVWCWSRVSCRKGREAPWHWAQNHEPVAIGRRTNLCVVANPPGVAPQPTRSRWTW